MAGKYGFGFSIKFTPPAGAEAILKAAAEKAFQQTAAELDGRFADAMTGANWEWPRESKRGVSGITVGEKAKNYAKKKYNTRSPRSIVDSGDLAGSRVFTKGKVEASWIWSIDYAAAVHDGARIQPWGNKNAKTVELPARPWTDAVLIGGVGSFKGDVFPFTDEMAKRITNILK